MANLLKNLCITKVDFVDIGANPEAEILLFKRKEGALGEDGTEQQNATRVKQALDEASTAFINSCCSILADKEKDCREKRALWRQTQQEYGVFLEAAGQRWIQPEKEGACERVTSLNTEKMTPTEILLYEDLCRRYGAGNDATPAAEEPDAGEKEAPQEKKSVDLSPEVQMTLDELNRAKEELEREKAKLLAKRYGIIGKEPEALAEKLVALRKSGGTVYEDYIALLDEQVNLVENTGLFTEIGKKGKETDIGGLVEGEARLWLQAHPEQSIHTARDRVLQAHPEWIAQYENQ